jgi:DNA polymerase-3 subunit delta
MERYAENPVDDATLVMRAATWRKGNLDKLILKHGTIEECREQPTEVAARWCIKRCARRYDATLEPDAAQLMVLRLGPALQRLDTELLKLASMCGKSGVITRGLVDENIALTREEKAWVVQSVVAGGDARAMLGKLHDLTAISPRTEWVPISWAVIDLLRKEHAASHLLRRGVNAQTVARQVKLWGDSIGPVLDAAQGTEPHRFAQLLRDAVTADQHSKSGLGEPLRNLEALMVKIADVTGR